MTDRQRQDVREGVSKLKREKTVFCRSRMQPGDGGRYLKLGPHFVCILGLLVFAPPALAGWSLFSDHAKLQGTVIVDVGEVSRRSTSRMVYDPLWEMNRLKTIEWVEFRGRQAYCFDKGFGFFASYLGLDDAALLVADETKTIYAVVVKSSIGSIDVEMEPVTLYECPSPSGWAP